MKKKTKKAATKKSATVASPAKLVINRDGLLNQVLRVQAFAKLICVAHSAEEFKQTRICLRAAFLSIDSISDDAIANTFPTATMEFALAVGAVDPSAASTGTPSTRV